MTINADNTVPDTAADRRLRADPAGSVRNSDPDPGSALTDPTDGTHDGPGLAASGPEEDPQPDRGPRPGSPSAGRARRPASGRRVPGASATSATGARTVPIRRPRNALGPFVPEEAQ